MKKPPPKSLFNHKKKPFQSEKEMLNFFEKNVFNSPKTMEEDLIKNIELIRSHAAIAEKDANLEGGLVYFTTISEYLNDMEAAMKCGNVVSSVWHAMKAVEAWMELRADAMFARAVREKERRERGEGFAPKLTDDNIIIETLKNCAKQKDAAKALGVNQTTLRKKLRDRPDLQKFAQWKK